MLLDGNGAPVPNAKITKVLNKRIYTGFGTTTDSNGYFTIEFPSIQVAVYHYFDIIPIVFLSNGKVLNSNADSLYHFAYSIYRPH